MATSRIEGTAELTKKLKALASPKEQANALRSSVRTPMNAVKKKAQVNIRKISPGKRALHRTYKGRLVSAGFALRNIRMIVKMSKDKQQASALLGVRKEAYYALQYFELGTSKIAAMPWLTPAFESSKDDMIRGVSKVLRTRIERIARQRGGVK